MEDLILIEYMRDKGLVTEHDFEEKLKDVLYKHYMKDYSPMTEEMIGIDATKARELVSKMYHVYEGRKCQGEKYDMGKAREIYNKYKSVMAPTITPAMIYLAINSQYHDYCALFREWFGDSIDDKIIKSALHFWFNDTDYIGQCKIADYFG